MLELNSMHRFTPLAKGRSSNNVEVYTGALSVEDGGVWNTVPGTDGKLILQWPKSGKERLPKDISEVRAVVHNTAPADQIHCAPPIVAHFNASIVNGLSIGRAVPYGLVAPDGTVRSPPPCSISGENTTVDLSRVFGRVKLYMTDLMTAVAEVTDDDETISLDGIWRVCGRLQSDNSITRDWTSVRYIHGNTLVRYIGHAGDTITLYVDRSDLISKDTSNSGRTITLSGEYPLVALDGSNTVVPTYPVVKRGATNIHSRNLLQPKVQLLLSEWMSVMQEGNFGDGYVAVAPGSFTPPSQPPVPSSYYVPEPEKPPMTFSFTCPSDSSDRALHIQLQISDSSDFTNILVDEETTAGVTNWWIFTGTLWESMPATGVDPGYYGQRVSYIIPPKTLEREKTYFIRYRVSNGLPGGVGDWRGEVRIW